MASRDKKSALTKKQSSASPIPGKDVAEPSQPEVESAVNQTAADVHHQPLAITKSQRIRNPSARLRKPDLRKNVTVKKPLKLRVNSKAKLTPATKARKTVLKGADVVGKVVKNGLTTKEVRSMVNIETRKEISRRKRAAKALRADTIDQCIDSILAEANKPSRKVKVKKFITADEIKKESTSDTDSCKQHAKKPRKPKLEHQRKKNKMDIIDMLDLNVPVKKKVEPKKRRHSIEKFSISDSPLFTTVPRCNSPRTRRLSKIRQSVDIRRSSPYTTRSESPARTLRNGKHRKLKHLLDGMDGEFKKRKRLCSDFSGSEVSVSKLSGYESDSSYSDLASLTDITADYKADAIKKELVDAYDAPISTSPCIAAAAPAVVVKRSASMDQPQQPEDVVVPTDTNSNLCTPDATQSSRADKQDAAVEEEEIPSFKVPEKSIILENMKANFNDTAVEQSNQQEFLGNQENTLPISALERGKRTTRSTAKKPTANSNELPSTSTTTLTDVKIIDSDVTTDLIDDPIKPNESTIKTTSLENTPDINKDTKPNITNKSKQTDVKIKPLDCCSKTPDTTKPSLFTITQPTLVIPISTSIPAPLPELLDIEDSITAHTVGVNNNNKERIVETPENMAIKENILSALGLQSLRAAEEAAARVRRVVAGGAPVVTVNAVACAGNSYSSGTLKTVIKLNRDRTKKQRSSLKMTLQKSSKTKGGKVDQENDQEKADEDEYKVMKEKSTASSNWKQQTGHSSDTAGAQRKTHYSNRSNLDGSSEHTSDGDTNAADEGNSGKLLVIPEKASSFSIHPGRVCKDECTYCFGKFGLFDTPCHIGSMKSAERQDKILNTEKHLTRDSCLCDACFRHVDRKSNAPSYLNNKSYKRNTLVGPGPRQNHCHVLGCANQSTNILKRKWIIKMRKAVCEVINIDLHNPGLHSIPVCEEHYSALEHLMVCAMCKRRLARNHIHYLGPESADLTAALNEMGIPVKLCNDRPVVCKLCKYFATLILKSIEDKNETTLTFENEYRKRLLHFHDIQVMNEEEADGPIPIPTRDKIDDHQPDDQQSQQHQPKKRRKLPKSSHLLHGNNTTTVHVSVEQSTDSAQRADSPSEYTVDYHNLIPAINIETGSDAESGGAAAAKKDRKMTAAAATVFARKAPPQKASLGGGGGSSSSAALRSDIAVKRLNSNTSISVRQLFPGEEDLPMNAHVDFGAVKERTPDGWEKCHSTIQYDLDTKSLWHELQKPYGNQSSFLRHLILLEKYFRNGDLILSPNATHHSSNYTESVQNRLRAYDNVPSLSVGASSSGSLKKPAQHETAAAPQLQPLNKLLQQYSKPAAGQQSAPARKTTPPSPVAQLREPPMLVNAANIPKSTPISFAHLTNLVSHGAAANVSLNSSAATTMFSTAGGSANSNSTATNGPSPTISTPSTSNCSPIKPSKLPPGLISLQPGTNKPVTPLVKTSPPSQKIKFPITKNWRPNLIPIDPTKKVEKRTGLVQVISGGKPYHITLEDYKKMCAIKRTFDLRQKRLQEQKSLLLNLSGATSPVNMQAKVTLHGSGAAVMKGLVPRRGLTISKRVEESAESSLEKLDKHVENVEVQFNADKAGLLHMPKIPKSLTVIPQTVVRKADAGGAGVSGGAQVPPPTTPSQPTTAPPPPPPPHPQTPTPTPSPSGVSLTAARPPGKS